jgi:hypothetical protein
LIEKKNFKEGLACFSKASDLDPSTEFIQQYVSSKNGTLFKSKYFFEQDKTNIKIISDLISQFKKTHSITSSPTAKKNKISYFFSFIKSSSSRLKNLSFQFIYFIFQVLFVIMYIIYRLLKRIIKSKYIFFYAVLFIIISVTYLINYQN